MKQLKNFLLLFLLLASLMPASHAQNVTTQGTEFWVSFMTNITYPLGFPEAQWLHTEVLICAKRDCQGIIKNPNTGWLQRFTVEADSIFVIDLPRNQAYFEEYQYEQIRDKGVIITTTDTVSVYCANNVHGSFDASYVLPTSSLADDYIITSYGQSVLSDYAHSGAFVVVATEDNTTIDITPSAPTLGGIPAHQEFSITLNRGQAYQVRSTHWGDKRDLSGTRVTARDCKKIAIFNGNEYTGVSDGSGSCVFEQAMPLRSWGKRFIITSSLHRDEDYVKITSSADNNVIRKNGEILCTLDANESFTFRLNTGNKSCYIETSRRSAVYLFTSSATLLTSDVGSPSMVWIAPIEQRINEINFSTFNYDNEYEFEFNIDEHYLNIVVKSQDVGQVYLDHVPIPSYRFSAVSGNAQYSFARQKISPGTHHLSCPNGLNAHVYGFGYWKHEYLDHEVRISYAYMVGSKATVHPSSINVNNAAILPNDTIGDCDLGPLTFFADINQANYDLLWEFGDGTTSTDNPVIHNYSVRDLYEVKLTVTTEEVPCDGSSTSNTYKLYIDSRRDPDMNYSDEVCAGELYSGHGFSDVLITRDTVLTRKQPGLTNPHCMIHVNVDISCIPLDETTVTESGHCDFFEWNGNLYNASGLYTDTIPNDEGCPTVHHLDLELDYTPSPTDIYSADTANTAPHWVVTTTDFEIQGYEFMLKDNNPACHWDTVVWSFENDIPWELEPLGDKGSHCKVYVLHLLEDTVWLNARVYNDCFPDGIERRFWLVSSFYGIEDGPSTGSGAFSVAPNPNNGQMQLNFENLIGRTDIKVFDMTGRLVDHFQTFNATHQCSIPYNCKCKANGIYLFVLNNAGRTCTKKVSIINPLQ
jgi:PKD repeat protein